MVGGERGDRKWMVFLDFFFGNLLLYGENDEIKKI